MIFKNVYVDTVIMLDRACGTDAFMYLNTLTTQQDKHRYKVINPIKMQHMCVCVYKALVTLFAGSLRPKTVAIAGSPCGCLKELASTIEVVRSKISGRGP